MMSNAWTLSTRCLPAKDSVQFSAFLTLPSAFSKISYIAVGKAGVSYVNTPQPVED